ncbi:MAG TPA: hypothetical protein DEV93_18515 [Chloroflexi bacterium]|nr:hypothetical protein [Chloroflexota bacterium]
MRIVTDADVPNSVADFLRSRGHEVVFSRDIVMPDSPDHLVARAASERDAIVLTWNRRHFLSLAKRRRGPTGPYTYGGMHLITFDNCSHAEGLQRLEVLIDEIETAYEVRVEHRGERMIAVVGRMYLRLEDLR